MIGPPPEVAPGEFDVDAMLLEELGDLKASQAAAKVAKITGLDRKTLYSRALELK